MTAATETIREADLEAIHRAIFHAPGDIHAAALAALGRVEAELARLRDEAKLGPQTQRCDNPECSVRTAGPAYITCPKCGGSLSAALAGSVAAGSGEEWE